MKLLKTDVAFATPWFELVAKTVDTGEAPYYSLRLCDYAAIVPLTEDGRVLAVRQYRPAVERYTIELPSGLVDANEDPAATARRELLEETGYEAASMEPLGPMFPDNGRLGNRIWSFLARGVRPAAGHKPEKGIEVLSYAPHELARAIASGEFDHALHVASLLLAILKSDAAVLDPFPPPPQVPTP